MRPGCAFIVMLLISATCLGALGPEIPLDPTNSPIVPQIHVRIAEASGHLLSVWSDGQLRGSLDGFPVDLRVAGAPVTVIGVSGGRKNFLIAYQLETPVYATAVLALRIGFDGRVLDPAPLVVDTDTHGFWGGNVAYDGSDFTVVTMEKHTYPSIIWAETIFIGHVSEDGVVGNVARLTSGSTSWEPRWPRIAFASSHLLIGYSAVFYGPEGIDSFGVSDVSVPPQDTGTPLPAATQFPNAGDAPRPAIAVGSNRVTLAWMNVTGQTATINIAQTDLEGRLFLPARVIAVITPPAPPGGTDVEIAWDGDVYLVAWATALEPWPGSIRAIRISNRDAVDQQPIDVADSAYPDFSLAATPDGFVIGYSRTDATTRVMRAFTRTIDRTDEPRFRRRALH